MNGIVSEIETQECQRPVAGEIFDNICHSRKYTINEIMSESEIQELRMPIAGEIFLQQLSQSHTNN